MVILLKLKGLKRQSHKGGQSQESGGIPMVAGSTDDNFCPVFSLNKHKHTDTTSFGSSLGKKISDRIRISLMRHVSIQNDTEFFFFVSFF